MKDVTFYECEFCHTQYKLKESALACEQNHHKPVKFGCCKYHAAKCSNDGYPDFINITFEDGKVIRYKR